MCDVCAKVLCLCKCVTKLLKGVRQAVRLEGGWRLRLPGFVARCGLDISVSLSLLHGMAWQRQSCCQNSAFLRMAEHVRVTHIDISQPFVA